MSSIIVLESDWENDLNTTQSVYPAVEMFAAHNSVAICHKHYHDGEELFKWIADFINHKQHEICYIAGHGKGKRLEGLNRNINIGKLFDKISQFPKTRKIKKGLYFGTCESGKNIDELFNKSNNTISWVAGYTSSVPWIASTMIDILFFDYYLFGATNTTKDKESFQLDTDKDITVDKSTYRSASRSYERILNDVKLASQCGFVVKSRATISK